MTTTDYALQANFKFGPQFKETLVNVPAASPEEMLKKLEWLTANAAAFVAAHTALQSVPEGLAGNVQPGSVQVQSGPGYAGQTQQVQDPYQQPTQQNNGGWGAPQQQAPPSFANPATQAPTCQHGQMVFRSGNGAKGPWSGHFCPTPKGTPGQCEPKFTPKGR